MIAGILGLALIDSLNPSALAVTVYLLLATRPYTSRVLVYLAAIFGSYFVLGLVLFLGAAAGLSRLTGYLDSDIGYVGQGVVGVALVTYGSLAGRRRRLRPPEPRRPRSHRHSAIALLGVLVTVAEIGTALPYLGAIGILTGADTGLPQAAGVLFLYNLVMVSPPLLLLLVYRLLGDRIRDRMESAGRWLMDQAAQTWLSILTGAGALLILSCIHHFELWKRIR